MTELNVGAVAAWTVATVLLVIVTPPHANARLLREAAPLSEQKGQVDQPGDGTAAVQSTNEFKASFQKLGASLESTWPGKFSVTIGGDGTVACSLRRIGLTNHQSRFRLQAADLRELDRILEQTGWLTRSMAEQTRPRVDEATLVNVFLTRDGQERVMRFDLLSPEPYRSLGGFIWRLQQQEQLQGELTATATRDRVSGCTHLIQALDQSTNKALPTGNLPLDFHRFVPAIEAILASPVL